MSGDARPAGPGRGAESVEGAAERPAHAAIDVGRRVEDDAAGAVPRPDHVRGMQRAPLVVIEGEGVWQRAKDIKITTASDYVPNTLDFTRRQNIK